MNVFIKYENILKEEERKNKLKKKRLKRKTKQEKLKEKNKEYDPKPGKDNKVKVVLRKKRDE